jgi:phosphoglycerol transferase MdoB-like AlkP superfamily enzyme
VSVDGGVEPRVVAPPLPRSIWVVAWVSLAGQVLLLVQEGVRHDDAVSLVGSVVLGVLLVGYVSAGVVRARTVRLVLAWVVLVLVLVADVASLVSADGPGGATVAGLSLVTTVVSLAALATFRRTDWYAWQRTRPPTHLGAPIRQLVAIGVLVGALGGIAATAEDGLHMSVRVAER